MKKAVALRYEPEKDAAPKVVAKGAGRLAERILRLARESGVPVKENQDLVEALMKVEIQAQVPPELYEAVATVLAWAWRLNKKL